MYNKPKKCDIFNLYPLYHHDSEWAYLTKEEFIQIIESHNYFPNLKQWLNPKKFYHPLIWYSAKPYMQQFKNGYIDEAYRTFDQYKHMDYTSCPGQFFFPTGQSIISFPQNTLWNKIIKWWLIHFTDKKTEHWICSKKRILYDFKVFEEKTFSDKNTVFEKIPYPVINFLAGSYQTNYHKFFLSQFLPFLYQWLQIPISERQKYKIAFSPFYANRKFGLQEKHIKSYLSSIGVQDNQYFYLQIGRLYQFPIVYRPMFSPYHQKILNTCIPYLKKHLYDKNLHQHYKSYEKIYVYRRTSTTNHGLITNFDEAKKILQKYHFKIIYMEDYSLKEKINLLSNVKYYISNRGAQATDSILTNNGTKFFFIEPNNPQDYEKKIWPITIQLMYDRSKIYTQYIIRKNGEYFINDLQKFEKGIQILLSM